MALSITGRVRVAINLVVTADVVNVAVVGAIVGGVAGPAPSVPLQARMTA